MSQLALIAPPAPAPESHGYRCLLADPPWWTMAGGGGRGAQEHYELLDFPGILQAMLGSPEWRPARDAHLWLWVPNELEHGLRLMDALGFRQVAFVPWVKRRPGGPIQRGTGQYLRYCSELLLLGVRGRSMRPEHPPLQLIEAQRTIHSRKPIAAYELIEQVSPGPRVEFFARATRDGWTSWGNEVPTP